MMKFPHSAKTLDTLAALVASVRADLDHSRWDAQGVRAALIAAARRPEPETIADLARAALTVAADPEARTPARIAHDGSWWSPANQASGSCTPVSHVRYASPDDCGICSRPKAACALDNSHEYEMRNRRGRASAEVIEQVKKQVRGAA